MNNAIGRFAPGQILRLKDLINDIEPGLFIFLRQEKNQMVLSRAGLDDDEGEICETNEIVRVHIDFEYVFQPGMGRLNSG